MCDASDGPQHVSESQSHAGCLNRAPHSGSVDHKARSGSSDATEAPRIHPANRWVSRASHIVGPAASQTARPPLAKNWTPCIFPGSYKCNVMCSQWKSFHNCPYVHRACANTLQFRHFRLGSNLFIGDATHILHPTSGTRNRAALVPSSISFALGRRRILLACQDLLLT